MNTRFELALKDDILLPFNPSAIVPGFDAGLAEIVGNKLAWDHLQLLPPLMPYED